MGELKRLTGEKFMKHAGMVEKVVDEIGIRATTELLAEISFEKADHLRTYWQSETDARWWERVGNIFDNTAEKIEQVV
jgi:hypothetical protein